MTDPVEAVREGLAGLEGPATLDGTVRVDVADGTDGDAVLVLGFESGRLVEVAAGPGTDADATFSLSGPDARAVLAGDLDLSVAFMQGRLKVSGSMAVVLDLLALSATDGARESLGRVAGLVEG
jgi:putative sterol carrier protein